MKSEDKFKKTSSGVFGLTPRDKHTIRCSVNDINKKYLNALDLQVITIYTVIKTLIILSILYLEITKKNILLEKIK
jgi:hypothetical protein